MADLLPTAGKTAPKLCDAPPVAHAMRRLLQRIFPPLSKEQVELLASVKFPCC